MRASTAEKGIVLTPPRELTIETGIEWINDDELVEVTPDAIRVRKRTLDHNRRRAAEG
jgi:GTP-binding protein